MNEFMNLHKNIKIRMITSFLTRSVSSMLFPFMAIYFAEQWNITISGMIMLVNVVASIVISLYGGVICDIFGRKKIMVVGQCIQLITIITMTIANSPFFDSALITMLMFILNGISMGLVNPAAEAMLIDVSTQENRSFMYSLNYWVINLSIMIGSIFGGIFYRDYRFQLYLILSVICVFTTYLLVFKMVETKQEVKRKEKVSILSNLFASYKTVAIDKSFLLFCLATLFVLSLEFQMYNYVSVRLSADFPTVTIAALRDFQLDGIRLRSILTTIDTCMIVLLTISISSFVKKRSQIKVLFVGVIIHITGFLFVGTSIVLPLLIAGIVIQTIGEMIYVPARQTIVANMVPADKRGAYMAIHGLVFQGAKIMGSLGLIIGAHVSTFVMGLLFMMLGIFSLVLFKMSISNQRTTQLMEKQYNV